MLEAQWGNMVPRHDGEHYQGHVCEAPTLTTVSDTHGAFDAPTTRHQTRY